LRVRIKTGKGITGAIRYVLGPGHDPTTGRRSSGFFSLTSSEK